MAQLVGKLKMSSLVGYASNLKWILPATYMTASAPVYYTFWLPMRVVTLVLPRRVFHAIDDVFYSMYQRMIVFFFEHYPGIEVVFYGEFEEIKEKKENVLYLSNHQCTIDWAVADMVALRCSRLGQLRYILKDELKYIPLYGYYFRQHGCVYVRRSKKFVPEKTARQMEQLRNLPFWLVIFPEGTRYSPEKKQVLESSKKYAEKEGLKMLDHVLSPRVKATHMSVNMLKGSLHAIYDLTIAYSNCTDENGVRTTAPSMADLVMGNVKKIHIHVKRIDISEVPMEEKALQEWLHERFTIKNKMMGQYFEDLRQNKEGSLGPDGKLSHLSLWQTLPVAVGFGAATVVCTYVGWPVYWRATVLGTVSGLLWMTLKW